MKGNDVERVLGLQIGLGSRGNSEDIRDVDARGARAQENDGGQYAMPHMGVEL